MNDKIEYDLESIESAVNELVKVSHGASYNAGWHHNIETGELNETTQELVGDKLMLIVTEVAEAKEGFRKNLKDDKLPHRDMCEVELADVIIRVGDLAGRLGYDLGGAVKEKLEFNANREDHKIENRKGVNGKKT